MRRRGSCGRPRWKQRLGALVFNITRNVRRQSAVLGAARTGGKTVQFHANESAVELVQGNVVDQDVDAIIDAANSLPLSGSRQSKIF